MSLITLTSGQFFGSSGSVGAAFVSTANSSSISLGIHSMGIDFEYVDPSNLFTMSAQANYAEDCIVGEKVQEST